MWEQTSEELWAQAAAPALLLIAAGLPLAALAVARAERTVTGSAT